jgi:hypothetical protein
VQIASSAFRVPDALAYLRECGLLTSSDVVELGVTVTDISHRNNNLQVRIGSDRGFLLKSGRNPATRATLEAEARAYAAFHELEDYSGLRSGIPDFHGWDEDLGLLVLELVTPRSPLVQDVLQRLDLPQRMGTILGNLHAAGTKLVGDATAPSPWPLSLHRPSTDSFRDLSPAHLDLVRRLQRNQRLSTVLTALSRGWRAETFIHGDVKWENWVWSRAETEAKDRLVLVDWEMTAPGDGAWDVGAVFAEFLKDWVGAVQIPPDASPELFMEKVYAPLPTLWPATRAFWEAYRNARAWDDRSAAAPLLRAAQMAAGWLLQRTYESHVDAHELSGNGLLAIDMSDRLLAEPHVAAVHILGLSLAGSA